MTTDARSSNLEIKPVKGWYYIYCLDRKQWWGAGGWVPAGTEPRPFEGPAAAGAEIEKHGNKMVRKE
jgi:hypothetical protein